jgi:cytochrome c556
MPYRKLIVVLAALAAAAVAVAGDDPVHERHELMEGVGDAAKVIGAMLKGEAEYDAAAAMGSLKTFEKTSLKFGDLFPVGSETGQDTRAAPAIWEDRAGFEAALKDWQDAIGAAIAADAATLDDAKPVLGAVFNACKGCHDNYRIKDE